MAFPCGGSGRFRFPPSSFLAIRSAFFCLLLDLHHSSALSWPPPLLHRLPISLFDCCASEVGSKTIDLKIGRVEALIRAQFPPFLHQSRSILKR
ncbi:hypothetical protein RHGRI_016402 [Rhododendron griersonianum]|uniref:Uncharacterized protein n=1 Tax=Rhododendron griersonianum TaxID=479676 RepID=A0AAV6JU28_9ERIC|nr:hypothetical protein RHGRI_016402 [Rhododendron griersonianum]